MNKFVFRLERETPGDSIVIRVTRGEQTPGNFIVLVGDGNDTAAVELTAADLRAFAAAITKELEEIAP